MILPEQTDRELLFFINSTIRNDILSFIFVFFSDRMSLLYILPFLLAAVYTAKKKGPEEFRRLISVIIVAAVAASLSDIITARIIKPIFSRPRPCQVIESLYFFKEKGGIWLLTDGASSYKSSFSFVSSHASNSITGAVIFGVFYKKLIPFLTAAVIMIGVSRPYLGHHYPSDIIGGWIFGLLLSSVILLMLKQIGKKYRIIRI